MNTIIEPIDEGELLALTSRNTFYLLDELTIIGVWQAFVAKVDNNIVGVIVGRLKDTEVCIEVIEVSVWPRRLF